MSSPEEGKTGPVIRDLRRIDPATGQVRSPGQVRDSGQAGPAQPGAPNRGADRPGRPGKHAASKPGGASGAGPSGAPGTQNGPGSGQEHGPEAGQQHGPEAGQQHGTGSGQQAEPREGQAMGGTAPEPDLWGKAQELADQLAERTSDLQRLSAEYANYRKRVERDRLAVREQALANVLSSLLPVLDDIGRARQHAELVGGFKSVAESLEAIVAKLGLSSFGEDGEAFDPRVHEAVAHSFSAEVTEPSVRILQPGYKVGERILRPAMVSVAEPEEAGGPGAEARADEASAADAGPQPAGEPATAGDPPGGAGPQESRGQDN